MSKPRYAYRLGWRSLRRVAPSLTKAEAQALARDLGQAMIDHAPAAGWDAKSASDFIAHCAHESGEFRYTREIWDGRGAQAGYWRRFRDLGNWKPAHGRLYRGGGWIQTTGRRNWARAAKRIGIKLSTLARRADDPRYARRYASEMAAIWWADNFPNGTRGMTVREVTRRVNGGYNGLADREKYTRRARPVARYLVPKRRSPR